MAKNEIVIHFDLSDEAKELRKEIKILINKFKALSNANKLLKEIKEQAK